MILSKKLLTKLIKEQIQEALDMKNYVAPPKPSAKHEARRRLDYVFYKDGEIAFYLIEVFPYMREGDSLKSELVSQLPAHDKYKVFGPTPSVLTNADLRRDGISDRIIDATTMRDHIERSREADAMVFGRYAM